MLTREDLFPVLTPLKSLPTIQSGRVDEAHAQGGVRLPRTPTRTRPRTRACTHAYTRTHAYNILWRSPPLHHRL